MTKGRVINRSKAVEVLESQDQEFGLDVGAHCEPVGGGDRGPCFFLAAEA